MSNLYCKLQPALGCYEGWLCWLHHHRSYDGSATSQLPHKGEGAFPRLMKLGLSYQSLCDRSTLVDHPHSRLLLVDKVASAPDKDPALSTESALLPCTSKGDAYAAACAIGLKEIHPLKRPLVCATVESVSERLGHP